MQSIVLRSLTTNPTLLALNFTKTHISTAIRCLNSAPSEQPKEQNRDANKTVAETTTNNNNENENKGRWLADNSRVPKRVTQEMRKVEKYMFTRYFDHVKNYDKVLEKNFPSAFKAYRKFFDGVKEFFTDMKNYLKISRIANSSPKGLKALNRKELELYMRMPRDMFKVAPAIIGSSLPVLGYLMFPIVFMYPRTFLTSHFWTVPQCIEFRELELRDRLLYNRDVLRQLQSKLQTIEAHEKFAQLKQIYNSIGSGMQPTVEELLAVKELFAEPPLDMASLSNKHLKLLMKSHGLKGFFKEYRLYEHAFLLHYMDLAIRQEGGVHNMSTESLRYCCFIRGLNPANLSNADMIDWLRKWINISISIQGEHISMFLHLPILLAYNHPNNWQLVYGKEKHLKNT